jgi:amidohydrolase
MQQLKKMISEIEPELIAMRRELHQWPETGLLEEKTCAYIEEKLKKWEISYEKVEPTGIVASIGKEGGRVIGLRADMDALPVTENTNLPFCSRREGLMHACGHDVHTAGLLGAAYALKKREPELKGKVKLLFQPAEEICKGATLLLGSGLIDDVESLIGLHVFADLPFGTISMEAGPRMARTDRFEIRLHGKGGHAAKPQQCVDTTVMAAALVMNLQTIVSRRLNPVDPAVVTIGSLHTGTQYNIISGEAVLEGTVRTFQNEVADAVFEQIGQMVENTARLYGGTGELIHYPASHPPLWNDKKVAEDAAKAFALVAGEDALISVEKMMLGEDFSNYQAKIPSAFGFLGGGKQGEVNYPNHHPSFDVDERSIGLMAKCYGAYALSQLII